MRGEWEQVRFTRPDGLDLNQFREKIEGWTRAAEVVLDALATRNFMLVRETSGGKTIIAFLAGLAYSGRVLFITPTRILARQHRTTWCGITNNEDDSFVRTGQTPAKEREWNLEGIKIVFATAHTFIQDVGRKVRLPDFALIILDECHNATKKHPYTRLAQMAAGSNIRVLALTASPGNSEASIDVVKTHTFVDFISYLRARTPRKSKQLILVDPDVALLKAEEILVGIRDQSVKRLERLGFPIDSTRWLGARVLSEMRVHLEERSQVEPRVFQALSEHAFYSYIKYLHRIVISESYTTFLEYIGKTLPERAQKVRAARNLLHDPQLGVLQRHIEAVGEHPKVTRLVQEILVYEKTHGRTLIFIGERRTGDHLCDRLREHGVKADVLYGKDPLINEKLDRFGRGEIEVLIATRVIEEGIKIPEVEVVIHYSMPATERSRIQRDGRTGVVRPGRIQFIAMKHPVDISLYYATLHGERRMYELVWGDMPWAPVEKGKKRENKNQLTLFFGD